MRIVVALGGNAMTAADGSARPEDQIAAAEIAMAAIAELVVDGHEVVVTHGNGPQVGNLLVKNELAAAVVPPVPLDWCGAQTQGTLGFVLMDALGPALAALGSDVPCAAIVTRTRVDETDPAFGRPTKPIGRYLPEAEAAVMIDHGQQWEDRGERGWRRVVASPEPLEILDAGAVATLVGRGYVVIANGGGGIPVVRDEGGRIRGVEAVIDKDLGADLLARALDADRLVIATDVDAAMLAYGTPQAKAIGDIGVSRLRGFAADGQFASGSMGPKVDAVCRFVETTGRVAVITSLGSIVAAVRGERGTLVHPDQSAPRTDDTSSRRSDHA